MAHSSSWISSVWSYLRGLIIPSSKPSSKDDSLSQDRTLEDFFNRPIHDLMIPRSDIVAIPTHWSADDVVGQFLKTGFLWLPVYRDTLDTIIGLVSVHCMLSLRSSIGSDCHQWYRHLHPPVFGPSSMKAREAMNILYKNPMLFVVDEYGGIEGIVTKDHLMKECLSMAEEFFGEDEDMIAMHEPHVVLNGRMLLEDFMEEFHADHLKLPDDEGRIHTLGGWMCAYVGRVPLTGEIIHHPEGWTFEIRQATPRQVHQIAIRQRPVQSDLNDTQNSEETT